MPSSGFEVKPARLASDLTWAPSDSRFQ